MLGTHGRPVLVAGLARALAALVWARWRQMWMPLQSIAPPGAEGSFSDAHAVSLFIFARRPAVVVMILISISAPFIC